METIETFGNKAKTHLATPIARFPGRWTLACSGRAIEGIPANSASVECKSCQKKAEAR